MNRTLEQINAELAAIAEDMADRWGEFMAPENARPGGESSMLAWVSSKVPAVVALSSDRRALVDGMKLQGVGLEELAHRLGWRDHELAHARDSLLAQDQYEDECVLVMASGRELRFPSWPDECDYVRVVDQGYELAYWVNDEWAQSPSEVMGAILGACRGPLPDDDGHEGHRESRRQDVPRGA